MSRLVLWLRYVKKAAAPAVVGFVAALVDVFVTWSVDWAQLRYALGGVITGLVVFKLENESHPAEVR